MKKFGFKLLGKDTKCNARIGRVTTAHGVFETPVFMPVGTQGSVKALTPRDVKDAGAEIVLSNAYHLYIRPGSDLVKKLGGLHKFMGWNGPILTDSGGYQVFSLSKLRNITEDGVTFNSHFDGRQIHLTPEKVIEIQEALGSDIAMIFDECPAASKDKYLIEKAVNITLRWAKRAKKRHRLKSQALFGIIQGGTFKDLRKRSLEETLAIGFDGYALGGLSVGEPKPEMLECLSEILPQMPADQPRYLMGVGTPLDFFEAVERGADMFDCVNPTRYGRNGTAFTRDGLVVVRNGKYQKDPAPIQKGCDCYACRNFSRAYLRHLVNSHEILGAQLITLHNVHFFVNLVKSMREHIRQGSFLRFKKAFFNRFDTEQR
ncbi:MAG: Queuine tRNA-ribosyltransferase [Candidatus Omnitrophica bacterium ADurb.Bin277]|nr:MAG: Queuine tRNA-ribosyltransferase [Candidatus Omnitrophica bacterium ADurb.Bin277]